MDLTFFKTLLEVAKWQNYTKAADMLGYAQSSVTSQIQKLENEYDITIFERIGKKMKPTPEGDELLRYASQLIRIYEESKVTVSGQCSGSFSIGTFEITLASYLLPAYLGAYKKIYPHITVNLKEITENQLMKSLKAGECDLGFMVNYPITDPDFIFEMVQEEEYVLIAAPDHPLAGRQDLHPSDLNGQEMIMSNKSCFPRQILENMFHSHQVQYQIAYEITSFEAMKKCVMHGLGISFVPKTIIALELEKGQLVALPLRYPGLTLYIQLVYHARKHISRPMRAFIESVCPPTLPEAPLSEQANKAPQL